MTNAVRFTVEAERDLLRLFDFLVEQDITTARHAQAAIAKGIEFLAIFPFSCRKAEGCETACSCANYSSRLGMPVTSLCLRSKMRRR